MSSRNCSILDDANQAHLHAGMLGLMVKDPNVRPEELSAIRAKTLVIAGTNDMIKEDYMRLIASSISESPTEPL